MIITKIQQQKHRADAYSISVDGAYAFSLLDEGLVKSGLKEGQEITEEELNAIRGANEKPLAFDTCLRLLEFRPRSSRELQDRLKAKKFAPDAIEFALAKLQELGFLNDGKFARQWAATRLGQGKGPEFVKGELRRKGISKEMIAEALEEMKASPEEEQETLQRLIKGKMKQLHGLPPHVVVRRLMGFLARRGFSIDSIQEALRTVRNELKEKMSEDSNGEQGE